MNTQLLHFFQYAPLFLQLLSLLVTVGYTWLMFSQKSQTDNVGAVLIFGLATAGALIYSGTYGLGAGLSFIILIVHSLNNGFVIGLMLYLLLVYKSDLEEVLVRFAPDPIAVTVFVVSILALGFSMAFTDINQYPVAFLLLWVEISTIMFVYWVKTRPTKMNLNHYFFATVLTLVLTVLIALMVIVIGQKDWVIWALGLLVCDVIFIIKIHDSAVIVADKANLEANKMSLSKA